MMLIFIWVLTSAPVLSTPDQLVFVQTLYRHGDRTPVGTYPTDPYQEKFWDVPWGELTKAGMHQQFLQGQRLKRLYVNNERFLSVKYSRYEIKTQSSDSARCLQSAAAQMAGFYSADFGYPEDTELLRLRAGFFLSEWIQNINGAIAGTKLKYYSYSGHEAMLNDLMLIFHAKYKVIGRGTANYAATISCEVWKRRDGYYLKFMYSADAYSEFVPFTECYVV